MWASAFLAFAGHRVPSFRRHHETQGASLMKMISLVAASNKEYFHRTVREASAATGKQLDIDPEELRQFVLKGEYDVVASPAISLDVMLRTSQIVSEFIYRFEWRVLEAPADHLFVTSDVPLVMVTTEQMPGPWGLGVGWYSPFMEAIFPLSPSACLLISQHHPAGRETTTPERAREVNWRIVAHADVQVYSSRRLTRKDLVVPEDWKWWWPLSDIVDPRFLDDKDPKTSNGVTC